MTEESSTAYIARRMKELQAESLSIRIEADEKYNLRMKELDEYERRVVDSINGAFYEHLFGSLMCFVTGIGVGYLIAIYMGT